MPPQLDAFRLAVLAAEAVGQLWLRVLVVAVIPLAATSLALALADLDRGALGRLGARALALAAASSTLAALIGIVLVGVVGPGRGVGPAPGAAERGAPAAGGASPAEDRSPSTHGDAAAASSTRSGLPAPAAPPRPSVPSPPPLAIPILALALASVGIGLGLGRLDPGRTSPLRAGVDRLHAFSTRAAAWVMRLMPLGVVALLFAMVARMGVDALRTVGAYVAVVIAGLLLHTGVVYSLALRLLAGRSPLAFFRAIAPAAATAFATASSAATLPTALRVAEERLRLPPAVARLVLTAGSAMNQNGTSLFEGVTILFLAQVYGVELSLARQAGVMAVAVLAGVGSAGVPGGGTAAIAVLLGLFGLPLEGIALVAGVDRLLDMCRTTVNVTGDLALAVVVDRMDAPPGARAGPPARP